MGIIIGSFGLCHSPSLVTMSLSPVMEHRDSHCLPVGQHHTVKLCDIRCPLCVANTHIISSFQVFSSFPSRGRWMCSNTVYRWNILEARNQYLRAKGMEFWWTHLCLMQINKHLYGHPRYARGGATGCKSTQLTEMFEVIRIPPPDAVERLNSTAEGGQDRTGINKHTIDAAGRRHIGKPWRILLADTIPPTITCN